MPSFTFIVDSRVREEDVDLVADAVLEEILDNTALGRDRFDVDFMGYSDSYKKSLVFKQAGKSSQVNLRLSGDMMAALDIVNITGHEVTIGYEDGDPEAEKAEGHIEGANDLPVRDFLGLPEDRIDDISSTYVIDDE